MKRGRIVITVAGAILCSVLRTNSQSYVVPSVGLRLHQLRGATTVYSEVAATQLGLLDYRTAVFQFGIEAGANVLKTGRYSLELEITYEFSQVNFVEMAYNFAYGSGSYVKNGSSGGRTTDASLGFMSVHRVAIPDFEFLSPFVGAGIVFDFFSTSDVELGSPSNPPAPLKGRKYDILAGLAFSIGAEVRVLSLTPKLQFKYCTPFTRRIQLTDSRNGSLVIDDAPDYFVLAVGLRFDLWNSILPS